MAESYFPTIPSDGAELARHAEFVRRLARGLVSDAALSEDIAQEAWVAALERREALTGSLRAWLARVLRNRAALALRSGARRARREAGRSDEGLEAPPEELVERLESHRHVVAAVLELPEPERAVVLLRYFQEQDTRAIARRLGLPEATVRTRLARAQQRLRRRLATRFGGDRALLAVGLARLAGEPRALTAPLPPLGSLVSVLAMKKTLIALAVALFAFFVLWSGERDRARDAAARKRTKEVSATPPAALREPETVAAQVASVEPARIPVADAPPPAPRAEPSPAAATIPEATAEPETAWLEFHVRDRGGRPVPEARVSIDCYRTRQDRGSSHSLSGMPVETTDADGVARIEYPRRLWPTSGGPERPEIGAVCYTIAHPDFVTARENTFDVDASPAEVVLRHGALLIVAGLLDQRATLVTDVTPHLSDGARVQPQDWVPVRDGRPSCNRLPAGRHALYLTRAGEGGTWASAVAEFELAEEEVRELTLELHPPRTLRGTLDPLVPRPVRNGEVLLNLHLVNPLDRSGPRGMRSFGAPVAADGSFTIADLPPGTGEMIGMCDGWVSRMVAGPEAGQEEESEPQLQPVDPGAGGTFVLAMERTARLELFVLGPGEEPVEGARIQLWPNVHWSNGYSQIFLDRDWHAVTDASGKTEVENLPAGVESLGLAHRDLCLPSSKTSWGAARRWAEAVLVSGETTTLELRLEPCTEGAGENE